MRRTPMLEEFLRWTARDNLSTTRASFWPKVNDIISFFDDVEIMFDRHDRITFVTKRCNARISFSMSAKCNPVVGSSNT